MPPTMKQALGNWEVTIPLMGPPPWATRYQSVSRVPPSAQLVPQNVSPHAATVNTGGTELQPPLVSAPQGSPSSRAPGGQSSGQPTIWHSSPQLAWADPAHSESQNDSQQNGSMMSQIRLQQSRSSQPGVPLATQQSPSPGQAGCAAAIPPAGARFDSSGAWGCTEAVAWLRP